MHAPPYGAHIFTPSLFFINLDMCLENVCERVNWLSFFSELFGVI